MSSYFIKSWVNTTFNKRNSALCLNFNQQITKIQRESQLRKEDKKCQTLHNQMYMIQDMADDSNFLESTWIEFSDVLTKLDVEMPTVHK